MEERKPRHLDREGLWNYALRALGGRAHSTGEMREKLSRRAERPEDVEGVLARLKESKYLDDRQFAESYATARLSNERFGKTRVLQDLRHRRVAPALAEKTVHAVYQDVDESALIEEWIRRKYRTSSARRIVSGGQGSGVGLPALVAGRFPHRGDRPRAEEVRQESGVIG